MTTESAPTLRIELLLNTLIGEQHVRRSLLAEVCELLGQAGRGLVEAHRAALELLAALDDRVGDEEFDRGIRRIARILARSSVGDVVRERYVVA